jgi:PD-(D/E)XK nuclease superfamily
MADKLTKPPDYNEDWQPIQPEIDPAWFTPEGWDDEDFSNDQADLERFIVENDELFELEQHIGRFNIFDCLGIKNYEIRHSNFLAWLLDPNESHGRGCLFLNAILRDLLRESPPEDRLEVHQSDMHRVRVLREFQHIDIVIKSETPLFVIAIENKIRSHERPEQLDEYCTIIKKLYPDVPTKLVYLTRREDDKPSDKQWISYTYRRIYDTLRRVRGENEQYRDRAIPSFLDHYLNSIGTWCMDDLKIDELCHTIYQKHQRAIDLIIKRIKRTGLPAVSAIAEEVKKLDRWKVVRIGPRYVHVIPAEWENLLPEIGKTKALRKQWLLITCRVTSQKCSVIVRVAPTTNSDLRQKIIQQLVSNEEFGLRVTNRARIGNNWTTLGRKTVAAWHRGERLDVKKVVGPVLQELERLSSKLEGVPAALAQIIEN